MHADRRDSEFFRQFRPFKVVVEATASYVWFSEFFRQFRPFKVVVEATASYVWFVELVEPLAEKVVLANPKKLRVIAESTKKTDRLDAQVLTEFLVLDMIPESYQPTPRLRQHRALVRHRQYLQGRITSVRSKIATSSATTTPTAKTCSRPTAARLSNYPKTLSSPGFYGGYTPFSDSYLVHREPSLIIQHDRRDV
jgi:hypothetical protein